MVIIVLATRSPGGSDQAVLWRSRTAHTYEQGGAFDSAVREGERQGAYLDPDGAAWHHIQNRAHDLTEALYILREEARTEGQRAQVEDALAALQAVRYALDAQVAPGARRRTAERDPQFPPGCPGVVSQCAPGAGRSPSVNP